MKPFILLTLLLNLAFTQIDRIKSEVVAFDTYSQSPRIEFNVEYSFFQLTPIDISEDTMFYHVEYVLKYKESSKLEWTEQIKTVQFYRISPYFLANVSDKFVMNLEAGFEYNFELVVHDKGSDATLETTNDISLVPSMLYKQRSSNFIVSNYMAKSDAANDYVRNGLFIVPNLFQVYNVTDRVGLYWYFELYNIDQTKPYELELVISSESGYKKVIKKEIYEKPEQDMLEHGVFNVAANLEGGKYELTLSVKNGGFSKNFTHIIRMKKNSYRVSDEEREFMQILAATPLAIFEAEFEALAWISSGVLSDMAQASYSYEDKKVFVSRYFQVQKRGNQRLVDMHNDLIRVIRYVYTNKQFRDEYEMTEKSLRNDVTWLLFRFGSPTQIERKTMSAQEIAQMLERDKSIVSQTTSSLNDLGGQVEFGGMKTEIAYEVWSFNIDGKSERFFLAKKDKHLFGPPELLHSTRQDIKNNPNWKKTLLQEYRQF